MKIEMKKNFLFCLIAVVAFGGNNLQLFAGTEEKFIPGESSQYILTVSKGDPASDPNMPVVYNKKPKNDVTVSFKVSIEKTVGTRREDISGNVLNAKYSVTISGNESVFVSCNPLYGNFTSSLTEYSKPTGEFYKKVTPVIRSRKYGDKTVTLNVNVKMKDNTELTASETIEFHVFAVGITIYAKVGNILTPPNSKDNFYYAQVNQSKGTSSSSGGGSTGHAYFKISADKDIILTELSEYVNKQGGYFPKLGKLSLVHQINIWISSESSDSPTTDGELKIPDNTAGGTNKEFGLTIPQMNAALRKIYDLHTSPSEYVLHSNNCVDVCIKVAEAAGLNLGKCQYNVKLVNANGNEERMGIMALPDELEKKLK
ncbi:MAG: hypothetical protein LBE12_11435 [Planctomycetaceae bacterium]|jgi:hypothetical protein|nr:hypothetical protein [Planctomycetaceae bacterium]